MSVRVTGTKELNRRLEAISRARPVLKEIQVKAVAEAKRRVARKTGHTGRTIAPGELGESFAIIQAAGAAPYLEFGTRPHVIRPKRASVLSWTEGKRLSGRNRTGKAAGGRIFAKKVNHPGTKPQPFLLPAAEVAVREVGLQPIIDAWNDAA